MAPAPRNGRRIVALGTNGRGRHHGYQAKTLRRYAEGMRQYKRHQWAAAKAHFKAALAAWPDDGPSRVYVERCDAHLASPPPPDWDFVVRRQEK